jgi:hypothetical protein
MINFKNQHNKLKIAIYTLLFWATYLTGCKPKCPGDEYYPANTSGLQAQGRQAIFKSNTGLYDTVTYGNWEFYEESFPEGADFHCHAHNVTAQHVKQAVSYKQNKRYNISNYDSNNGFCFNSSWFCRNYYNKILYTTISIYQIEGTVFNDVIVDRTNVADSINPCGLAIGVQDGIIMQEYLTNNYKDTLRWVLQK